MPERTAIGTSKVRTEYLQVLREAWTEKRLVLFLGASVDDFDMALPGAALSSLELEEEPHVNPNTGTMEFSLRDPDGYYVTISALAAAKTERGS